MNLNHYLPHTSYEAYSRFLAARALSKEVGDDQGWKLTNFEKFNVADHIFSLLGELPRSFRCPSPVWKVWGSFSSCRTCAKGVCIFNHRSTTAFIVLHFLIVFNVTLVWRWLSWSTEQLARPVLGKQLPGVMSFQVVRSVPNGAGMLAQHCLQLNKRIFRPLEWC